MWLAVDGFLTWVLLDSTDFDGQHSVNSSRRPLAEYWHPIAHPGYHIHHLHRMRTVSSIQDSTRSSPMVLFCVHCTHRRPWLRTELERRGQCCCPAVLNRFQLDSHAVSCDHSRAGSLAAAQAFRWAFSYPTRFIGAPRRRPTRLLVYNLPTAALTCFPFVFSALLILVFDNQPPSTAAEQHGILCSPPRLRCL